MTDLSPCPFCGYPARVGVIRDGKQVFCINGKCLARGPARFNGPLGIPSAAFRASEAWNTRASPNCVEENGK